MQFGLLPLGQKKGITTTLTASSSTFSYFKGSLMSNMNSSILYWIMCFKTSGKTVLMVCTHCCCCQKRARGAMTVCQPNVAQQLLITEEHLSHLGVPLHWAILVDFYQVSDSSSPAGAEAAFRMLPLRHLNIWDIRASHLA